MEFSPRASQGSTRLAEAPRGQFPWSLAIFVIAVLTAVGVILDNDRSLSEREGVVTQTDAENDVIPSLPPEGR